MKTYPDENMQHGHVVGFEIDNVYIGIGKIARILKTIDGVTDVKKRRLFSNWENIHIWFKYMNCECVVIEPFGDNSRYWIGPKSEYDINMHPLEKVFAEYQIPAIIKIFGDLITLNFKSLLGK